MSAQAPYTLLPFQFGRLRGEEYLLVNEAGEYHFMTRNSLESLVDGTLPAENSHFDELRSKQFLVTRDLAGTLDMVATRYRTRKHFIINSVSLHMMVLTVRCNQDCQYCQVSAESDEANQYDMAPEVAEKSVEVAFMSPSPFVKIEFQGGEPTLNWDALTRAVHKAEELNKSKKKVLEFVLCTNLTGVTTEKLEFLRDHGVCISTSLDGPQPLHDKNRLLRKGGGTYDMFIANLQKARDICGDRQVSALMTTTVDNINHLKEVVEEYIRLGFPGIFIRSLNPYGLAAENAQDLGYPMESFTKRYEETLDYIVELNLKGKPFTEYFATILLSRILTPFSTGFVDLQSPSGAGISSVIYDYNGDVYPADEARMLSRMGDKRFLMGNVFTDSYKDIFGGPVLREIVAKSIVEIMPGCASCVYRTYCGADPIRNYLETGDVMGRRPGSTFCKKNMAIFESLFRKLRDADDDVMDVFWSWVTRRSLQEVRREGL
jgi:His-Xaa-Ser system radical SAM maturase HxsB